MIELILDGEIQDLDTAACANLAELVAAAERAANAGESEQGEPQVVVAIAVDGVELRPDLLAELQSQTLDGVKSVSIERRPSLEVARSVLQQAADYTSQIEKAIGETVDHYRSGRRDLGSQLLADITDSLTVLTGVTVSISQVLPTEAQTLADRQGEIYPWLEQLFEAQSVDDPTMIADTLEYEVGPRIEGWGEMMRGLGGAVANEAN